MTSPQFQMQTVAVAIICKTPIAGESKTRLSPLLQPEECAEISRCFIKDISGTIKALADEDGGVAGCAIYTPAGSQAALRKLLPQGFVLIPQSEGDLGVRLVKAIGDLLGAGYAGAILVNSDSPTLPKALLRDAVDAVRSGDNVTLSPAFDGGYTLVGLSRLHARLFSDIPWSTSAVYQATLDRAREIGLPVETVPGWYDVDDAASFRMLEDELSGRRPSFAAPHLVGAGAPATLQFIRERQKAFASRT